MKTIKMTTFATRQTKASPFSYLAGFNDRGTATAPWHVIEDFAEECLDSPDKLDATLKDGYKPGVVIISVPYGTLYGSYYQFYTGVVQVTAETELVARLTQRQPGEAPYLEVLARGDKTPAVSVDIVLYSRELLAEEGVTVDADYGIVTFNAHAETSGEPEPMTPMAMARNFLGLPGGTKAEYTAEQFAKAIIHWSTRAMHMSDVE